jgi:hypothetical protein
MIVPNEPPDAPEWVCEGATCRDCGKAWHTERDCLALPAGIVLGSE